VIQALKCAELPHQILCWYACIEFPIEVRKNVHKSLQKVDSEVMSGPRTGEDLEIPLSIKIVDVFLAQPGRNIALGSRTYP